jgi:hypothetical protein
MDPDPRGPKTSGSGRSGSCEFRLSVWIRIPNLKLNKKFDPNQQTTEKLAILLKIG